jgi:hypothetical protein
MPAITTKSEHTGRWTKMHRRFVPFNGSGTSRHTPSSGGFITITYGFRFSVQTGRQKGSDSQKVGPCQCDFRARTFQSRQDRASTSLLDTVRTTQRSNDRRAQLRRPPMAIKCGQHRHPGAPNQLTLFAAATIVLLIFAWSYVNP